MAALKAFIKLEKFTVRLTVDGNVQEMRASAVLIANFVAVMNAGGWSDIGTLLKCYQHADNETLLEVMTHSKKISEAASVG